MELDEIRRVVITALFSDDELMERFVLKGGNALALIHKLGHRSSIDVDVSIPDDFEDIKDTETRLFHALQDRFDAAGYIIFDTRFQPKPSKPKEGQSPRWGGYLVEFKITPRATFEQYRHDPNKLSQTATVVSPGQKRIFKIDISKYEFCENKQEVEFDSYTIYVYSLSMIAIEKLRAICQQMEDYPQRRNPKPRARDFYDIYSILTFEDINLTTTENIELLKNIFAAKEVSLSLLPKIEDDYDFHIADWDSVRQSVSGELKDFGFYFNFVLEIVKNLQTAGVK